jgi:hypothetical protein
MADTTDLLKQILSKLDEQGREITTIRTEHGEKLDKLDVKVDRLEDGQTRQLTMTKILQGAIEETRAVVDKLLHRPRQAD